MCLSAFLVIDITEQTNIVTSLFIYLIIIKVAVVVMGIIINVRNLTDISTVYTSLTSGTSIIKSRTLVVEIRNCAVSTDRETSALPRLTVQMQGPCKTTGRIHNVDFCFYASSRCVLTNIGQFLTLEEHLSLRQNIFIGVITTFNTFNLVTASETECSSQN